MSIRKSDKLVEATMLALQGKLTLKENKVSRKTKKSEAIDVNIDETTTVSVEGNETIVDTQDATVIVNKKEDTFVPETSDNVSMEAPVDDVPAVVDAPVAPMEDTVDVPVDDTVMPDDLLDEPVDTEMPESEPDINVDNNDDDNDDDDEEEEKDESKIIESKQDDSVSDEEELKKLQDEIRGVDVSKLSDKDYEEFKKKADRVHELVNKIYNFTSLKGEGKQADENEKDIMRKKKARFIAQENKHRSEKISEMKARRAEAKKAKTLENLKTVVAENRKLMERKYTDGVNYVYNIDGVDYIFFCDSWETSKNWGHEVKLVDGGNAYKTLGTARCTYYNRTWEKYQYQSCMLKAIDNATTTENKEIMEKLKQQVDEGKGLTENKSAKPTKKSTNDLGINADIPKKEEPFPNTATEVKKENVNKFSSKSFNEALTRFYSKKMSTVESVNVTKVRKTAKGLKIEANLINKLGKVKRPICLEMRKIQTGKSFDKYEMIEVKGLVKENKSNNTKTTMTTFTNRQNVIECRYILSK